MQTVGLSAHPAPRLGEAPTTAGAGPFYAGLMAGVRQVTFDCADPRAVAEFWKAALGYVDPPTPPGFDSWDAFDESLPGEKRGSAWACQDPHGVGPRLFFQRVPDCGRGERGVPGDAGRRGQ